jgi:hypothetical protein
MGERGTRNNGGKWPAAIATGVAAVLWAAPAAAQVVQPQGGHRAPAAVWEVPEAVGETCVVYDGAATAADWLGRTWEALAVPGGHVLHLHVLDQTGQIIQSDRPYPPYLTSGAGGEIWIDPADGMIRDATTAIYPGSGRWGAAAVTLYDREATWMARDTLIRAVPQFHPFTRTRRSFDPISVIRDWRASRVRVAGTCRYREDERVVLERTGRFGAERLYLDRESALPVKTDRVEPQFLWGQVQAEVVWATWWTVATPDGYSPYPLAASRLLDGEVVDERAVGAMAWMPRAEAPGMDAPRPVGPMDPGDPGITPSPEPDTVRVSDRTYLLVNDWYTEVATLQRDTVWLLDATLGENRARQDHEWIRRLFGDEYPVAVVVTDLAWPHVAGVRYWVAQGATVISEARSEAFLRRVVEREWTLRPDALEERRDDVTFRFRPVDGGLDLADGALRVRTIGGIGSEGAVLVWLPGDRFLWPGDYIQTTQRPTTYAAEVLRAVRREGFRPERFAAQHNELTAWSVVEALFRE